MERIELIKSLEKIKKELLINEIVNHHDRLIKITDEHKEERDKLLTIVKYRDKEIEELTADNKKANDNIVYLTNKNNKLKNAFYITAYVAAALIVSLMIILFY